MVHAHELRIGNWVSRENNTGRVYGVENYPNKKMISFKSDHLEGEFSFAEIQPIPLTPEILEKAGFKFRSGNHNKWYYNGYLKLFIHADQTHYSFYPYEWNAETEIHFLHQLQNLYFALTGTELEVKL